MVNEIASFVSEPCPSLVVVSQSFGIESTDCLHASSANVFKNRIDKYLVKAGYT